MGGSPMLELSNIQTSQEELQDYYAQLQAQHVTPAWTGGGISIEPGSEAVPDLWHLRDCRPHANSARPVGCAAQAARPVLSPRKPPPSPWAVHTHCSHVPT